LPRTPRASHELTREDLAVLARALRRLEPFDDDAIALILPKLRARTLRRGEYLLREGQVAGEIVLVVSGLLREYFLLADGTQRTKAFVEEGSFSGSLADLLSGGPSRAYIVAEEQTRLLVAPFAWYQRLSEVSPAWARLATAGLVELLLRKAEREYELLGLDAAARYAALRARCPALEARVHARHVASYLGITPVHLSRLRRGRRGAHRTGV
jgi:CRP-like cAMP-binding protein